MCFSVLIIDDSKMDRFISETVIEKTSFARHVVSYSTVADGLNYLQSLISAPEKLPQVIFLDVNLPAMDGFDFLDNFLKLSEDVQKRCTVFMVSATSSVANLERIKEYPVVRKFFNKPLTPEILKDVHVYMIKQPIFQHK